MPSNLLKFLIRKKNLNFSNTKVFNSIILCLLWHNQNTSIVMDDNDSNMMTMPAIELRWPEIMSLMLVNVHKNNNALTTKIIRN